METAAAGGSNFAAKREIGRRKKSGYVVKRS
jgi:hypothetical protein